MSESAAKAAMRERLRGVGIGPAESAAVCARLDGLAELASAPCVLAYLALPDEVSVDGWIEAAIGRGVVVGTPRVDWTSGRMEAAGLRRMGDWIVGRHGLREPAADAVIMPIEEVGAVLVPGLGFDGRGGRLGRGGGFYDRLLARLPASAVRIGVAALGRVVDRVPAEEWDQRLDLLVTATDTVRFERD